MVVIKHHKIYVIEAIGPVKYTPLSRWLKQGRDNFTQLRPVDFEYHQITRVVREAEKLLGKPYDIQYELDEEKIYCSELIYKAYLRATQKEVGKKEQLNTLNWKPHQEFIKYICRGQLPLNRELVTPESLAVNSNFIIVRSTFPEKLDSGSSKLNSIKTLAGKWEGEYTIAKETVTTRLSFSENGKFIEGSLCLQNDRIIKIESLILEPTETVGLYTAQIVDERKVSAKMVFYLKDNGHRIIGTWKDNFYNYGNFSLEKEKDKNPATNLMFYNDKIEIPKQNVNSIDIYSKLKKLYELKQQNILTDEEYQKVKTRLLNQIK